MSITPSILRKVATFITWAAIEARTIDIKSPTSAHIHLLGHDQLHVLGRLADWSDDSSFEYETAPTAEACRVNVGANHECPTIFFALYITRDGITHKVSTAIVSQPHVDRLLDTIPGLRDAKACEDKPVTLDLLRELASAAVNA